MSIPAISKRLIRLFGRASNANSLALLFRNDGLEIAQERSTKKNFLKKRPGKTEQGKRPNLNLNKTNSSPMSHVREKQWPVIATRFPPSFHFGARAALYAPNFVWYRRSEFESSVILRKC